MTPKRIERKRTKGWKMPPNTVYVGRPSKWGNPFVVGEVDNLLRAPIDQTGAVGMFEDMLNDTMLRAAYGYPDDLSELKGKNLACWCPQDQPCHADVLLELANKES